MYASHAFTTYVISGIIEQGQLILSNNNASAAFCWYRGRIKRSDRCWRLKVGMDVGDVTR